ncbi:hypothetical protein LN042_22940 [Kitasatospora sp. RB6PN24]|uniref:hypothetical protein n=1 Tax=Kitasatospora humi TaxID=2893891 RepID=UPI001E513758|nr:hypothetical protein [Kitasatospora humi]MCC9309892.1 hypothetical protein [Kitasatospora humi]
MTVRTLAQIDRDVWTLYRIAYAANRLAPKTLANPGYRSSMRDVQARVRAADALAQRLLARPGVAENEETPYAVSLLRGAVDRVLGSRGDLAALSEAAGRAARHRPVAATGELLHLADWARELAAPSNGRAAKPEELQRRLAELRSRAVAFGLTAEEAAGTAIVPRHAVTGAAHFQVLFTNAISRRGQVSVCFATEELADAAAVDYYPFNNTDVYRYSCKCRRFAA